MDMLLAALLLLQKTHHGHVAKAPGNYGVGFRTPMIAVSAGYDQQRGARLVVRDGNAHQLLRVGKWFGD